MTSRRRLRLRQVAQITTCRWPDILLVSPRVQTSDLACNYWRDAIFFQQVIWSSVRFSGHNLSLSKVDLSELARFVIGELVQSEMTYFVREIVF